MRFLTWNIQSGGGSRISSIVDEIAKLRPDVMALTEVRFGNLETLTRSLRERGYPHIETTCSVGSTNSVLAASRFPFKFSDEPVAHDQERWLPIEFEELNLKVLCVHIPGGTDNKFDSDGFGLSGMKRKELLWDEVIQYATRHRGEKTVLLGDFNTGLAEDAQGTPFVLSNYIRTLRAENYVDTWRHLNPRGQEFTWYTKRKNKETSVSEDYNGFRLDYVFVSLALADRILDARHIHNVRLNKLSDHAMVLTEVIIGSPSESTPTEPGPFDPPATSRTADGFEPKARSKATTTTADELSGSLVSALTRARIPVSNHVFIGRFTTAIGIADYRAVQADKPYVIATRRDGGRDLRIFYGYTTGFTSEDEISRLFGEGAGRNSNSPKGTWWVAHPTNQVRPSGKRSQDVRRQAKSCSCGMQLSLTGVCDNCD